MAAVLASQPSVSSHLSAGWLWGLLPTQPGTLHVTAPASRRAKRAFVVHCAELAARDQTELQGIPVTSLARTQLDLAAMLPMRRLERALERSEEQQQFDLFALEDLLGRAGHHPGAGKLRAALAIYRDDPAFIHSKFERRFLDLVRAAGLPVPTMNLNVAGYELDAYWETERFAVELDVYATHGSRAAFERDRVRDEDLKLKGIELIRITDARLSRDPEGTVERIAAHLRQRRRDLDC